MVINTTDDIISYPGTFIETIIPDKAAGITPVSLTHIINSLSLKLQLAFLSNNVHINTTSGLAINIKTKAINKAGAQYLTRAPKSTYVPNNTNIDILNIVLALSAKWCIDWKSYSGIQSPNNFLFPDINPAMNTAIYPLPPRCTDIS